MGGGGGVRFVVFKEEGVIRLGALAGDVVFAEDGGSGSADLASLVGAGLEAMRERHGRILAGREVDAAEVEYLPPIPAPGKILCVGLNYREHARERGSEPLAYPAFFARFRSSLVGHRGPIVRPAVSEALDYEGELVAVVGKPGRNIARERALEHVAGYSIFNDASVRDYQYKSPQWTIGKNFDGTGGCGPAFVTADELPPGAKGLRLETRLNGAVMQSASTADMMFDVATLVSLVSDAMRLEPGDLIVTGTPSGVGFARDPKVFLKPGDVCEVEIEGIGVLQNPVVQQGVGPAAG